MYFAVADPLLLRPGSVVNVSSFGLREPWLEMHRLDLDLLSWSDGVLYVHRRRSIYYLLSPTVWRPRVGWAYVLHAGLRVH